MNISLHFHSNPDLFYRKFSLLYNHHEYIYIQVNININLYNNYIDMFVLSGNRSFGCRFLRSIHHGYKFRLLGRLYLGMLIHKVHFYRHGYPNSVNLQNTCLVSKLLENIHFGSLIFGIFLRILG